MKSTEISVRLVPLPEDIGEPENLINAKISDLLQQGYFLNSVSISQGVAILLVGKSK